MIYVDSSVAGGTRCGDGPAYGTPRAEHACDAAPAWVGLGDLLVTEIDSPQQCCRVRMSGARMYPPRFFVYLVLAGEGAVHQDGREARLYGDDFTLCDGTRPYEVGCPPGTRMLVVGICAAKLRRHVACPELLAAHAMRAAGGVGTLLSDLLRGYWCDCRHGLGAGATEQVAAAILALLGAAYAQVPRAHDGRCTRGAAHRIRVLNYIHAHLYDSDLTPARIAVACQITVRYVHYLFSSDRETVARYILRRRLEACSEALLADSQRGRTVTAIAFDHGFNSATHFGRVFRAYFAMTPRDYRARADVAPQPAGGDRAAAGPGRGC